MTSIERKVGEVDDGNVRRLGRQMVDSAAQQLVSPETVGLRVDTTEYPAAERRALLKKFYPANDGLTVEELLVDKDRAGFMAAPPTMDLVYRDFLQVAGGFARTAFAQQRERTVFLSLQHLAGVASYPEEFDLRVAMCDIDIANLYSLKQKFDEYEIKVGPALHTMLHYNYQPAFGLDYAPARLAIDDILTKAAGRIGYTVGGAESRGYRPAVQTALVVDFTRAIDALRKK